MKRKRKGEKELIMTHSVSGQESKRRQITLWSGRPREEINNIYTIGHKSRRTATSNEGKHHQKLGSGLTGCCKPLDLLWHSSTPISGGATQNTELYSVSPELISSHISRQQGTAPPAQLRCWLLISRHAISSVVLKKLFRIILAVL